MEKQMTAIRYGQLMTQNIRCGLRSALLIAMVAGMSGLASISVQAQSTSPGKPDMARIMQKINEGTAGLTQTPPPVISGAPSQSIKTADNKGTTDNAVSDVDILPDSLKGLPYLTLADTLKYHSQLENSLPAPQQNISLLFQAWEYAMLKEAKSRMGTVRPATEGELQASLKDGAAKKRGVRELGLGGILYRSDKDWTIWLNGNRVTPNAIPKQVMDIKVKQDHIDLKWFDSYTNLIYPLRLRPHQRFNLDNRIFLPGAGQTNVGADSQL